MTANFHTDDPKAANAKAFAFMSTDAGGGMMSYTVTLNMPQKATEYIERRGVRFQKELNAILLAFVMTQMQYEDVPVSPDVDESTSPLPKTGAEFVRRLRGVGPFLSDEEMHIFDRVKDYGREVELV